MKFSQRIGKREVKTELEREGLSDELRNSLWSLIVEDILRTKSNEADYSYAGPTSELARFFIQIWKHFFKFPIDTLSITYDTLNNEPIQYVRNWYFEAKWYDAFDFLEFCLDRHKNIQPIANEILKREMSAYRFIDGTLIEVNSKEEVVELESALTNTSKFKSVKEHLTTAISLYSNKKSPDYRNSIKESISAVESLSKIITGNDKTTLGQALKEIEKTHGIPGSLKSAFSALYGYTSDEGGIRHSLLESGVTVGMEEARFMLVACSAFVNYLISKK